jgi:hypothetical protein
MIAGGAVLFTAVLSLGCGKGKIEQCNAFIDEGNSSQNAFVAIEAAMLNPQTLQGRIDKIEEHVKKLQALQLSDAKLAEMRGRYVEMLQGFAKSLKQFIAVGKDPKKDAERDKIAKDLDANADKSSKLIDDINQYCGGSK